MISIGHDKLINLINVRLHCRLFWRRLKTRNQIQVDDKNFQTIVYFELESTGFKESCRPRISKWSRRRWSQHGW